MKVLVISIVTLFLGSCCHTPKIRIHGNVKIGNKTHSAVWYTDTISIKNDTVSYTNSDGSIVKIAPPYVIELNR